MTEALAALPQGPIRRVAFLGTPDIAATVLQDLVLAGIDVGLVVTRADKRRARGNDLFPSPVKKTATELGIPVVHVIDDVLTWHANDPFDLAVVVAFGSIIKPHVLAQIPMVNLHVSLLPRWRGAAPIERALLAGDKKTGVCLMQVEHGLDTGGVLGVSEMEITDWTTAEDIRRNLVKTGTAMLLEQLRDGLHRAVPQEGVATYAEKIVAHELCIDWNTSSAVISRLIRLGGAWTNFRGKRLKIHEAQVIPVDHDVSISTAAPRPGELIVARNSLQVVTGLGLLNIGEVQPEGKSRMDIVSWLNGIQPKTGEKLTSE